MTAQPALDFSAGQTLHLLQVDVSTRPHEHPVRSAPDSKFRPAIRLGCAVGDLFRRHSWDSSNSLELPALRRFHPNNGCGASPRSRACMPFALRSPRFIFVAEPSVLWKSMLQKGTGDHERLVRLPGLPPVIDPSGGPSRQPFDPALGFASCRIFGSSIGTSRAGSTPRRSSASGPARLQSRSGPYPLMGLLERQSIRK
jgi:hypothetical protein